MMLLTNWAAVWEIAGMGVGVVFAILVLLVFVLQIFSAIAGKAEQAPAAAEAKAEPTVITPEDTDYAAVAVAMWLNYHSQHDQDSGKLTINNENERWHEVLNPSL